MPQFWGTRLRTTTSSVIELTKGILLCETTRMT
uniref:Uncharacterized protein n=1 Tax=Siphoviridae sp. ctGkF2 TaxID=2827823 RepID=A0A8S5TLJ6_9CAUD|nr:MAG TPA: hypothetical protein [Siphoviridae sp. ctGkF2]